MKNGSFPLRADFRIGPKTLAAWESLAEIAESQSANRRTHTLRRMVSAGRLPSWDDVREADLLAEIIGTDDAANMARVIRQRYRLKVGTL